VTTQPCVSIGTGTLSPDLRVFYQYGMVLGLDDFLQEQTHNLGLDYHHERALHGYGTVYGLQVTTSTPSDAPADVTVTVEPGMAIDQFGREVTVPTAQCARLGAWLAAQDEASAGTVEANLGISGELVVYVVAAYAECPDDLVPLPGQPCSTSSQVQVPSRLRDAWDIDLRWAPPAMPAWDVVRQLAQLLNSVQVVPGLDPALSSEEALTGAVLALPSPQTPSDAPSGSPPGPVSYQLPAEDADDAFGRILTVWVTQVRPQLPPDLTAPDPSWDPSVLLAAITCHPQLPFLAANPVITSYSAPDDTGRPYLLHTGLIQELRLGGAAGPAAPPVVQEAVTLSATADTAGVPALLAWFHLAQPVSLPATINVVNENGQTGAFATTATSGTAFSPTWTLSAPDGYVVADGDELAATFPGAAVMVGDNATTLAAALVGQSFLSAASTGDVTAYAPVRVPAAPPAPPASVPFVTVTYVPPSASGPVGNKGPNLELWFHPQPTGLTENVVVLKLPVVQVVDDLAGTWPGGGNSPTPQPTGQGNIWTIAMTESNLRPYLRLLFDTEKTEVATPQGVMSLAAWIAESRLRYVGWDGKTIVSFLRIATATETQG
jgi:hypothetical protein